MPVTVGIGHTLVVFQRFSFSKDEVQGEESDMGDNISVYGFISSKTVLPERSVNATGDIKRRAKQLHVLHKTVKVALGQLQK